MSRELKHGLFAFSGAVAALAFVALLPLVADRAPAAPREIVLVTRNMTFYLDGESTPNPTIRLKANETIRLVLRNEDPGMTHNVAIDSWGVATPSLHGEGAASTEFRVPARPGRQEYLCTPHAQTMRGLIEIE